MQYAIFIDIESNGLDSAKHRCLEIALKVVDIHTGEEVSSYTSLIKQPEEAWKKSDLISLQINGMTWSQVQEGKTEQEVSQEITELFCRLNIHRSKAFFLAQNPSFDRAFFSQLITVSQQDRLEWPYHWLDFASMCWALHVKSGNKGCQNGAPFSLSKDAIAAKFGLPPEQKPHRAMRGVEHLITCYAHVVGWETVQ